MPLRGLGNLAGRRMIGLRAAPGLRRVSPVDAARDAPELVLGLDARDREQPVGREADAFVELQLLLEFLAAEPERAARLRCLFAFEIVDVALDYRGRLGRGVGEIAKDVQIVNQRMAEAVTSFVSGAVPAVALWVPFDQTVKQKVPNARKVVDASAFFPEAAIMGGWAARNDFYDASKPALASLIAGWVEVNDAMLANFDAAAETLQKTQYKDVPLADFRDSMKFSKYYTSSERRKLYGDGTAPKRLQQVTDFFATAGNIASPVPASKYFDPQLYLSTVKA